MGSWIRADGAGQCKDNILDPLPDLENHYEAE